MICSVLERSRIITTGTRKKKTGYVRDRTSSKASWTQPPRTPGWAEFRVTAYRPSPAFTHSEHLAYFRACPRGRLPTLWLICKILCLVRSGRSLRVWAASEVYGSCGKTTGPSCRCGRQHWKGLGLRGTRPTNTVPIGGLHSYSRFRT